MTVIFVIIVFTLRVAVTVTAGAGFIITTTFVACYSRSYCCHCFHRSLLFVVLLDIVDIVIGQVIVVLTSNVVLLFVFASVAKFFVGGKSVILHSCR